MAYACIHIDMLVCQFEVLLLFGCRSEYLRHDEVFFQYAYANT